MSHRPCLYAYCLPAITSRKGLSERIIMMSLGRNGCICHPLKDKPAWFADDDARPIKLDQVRPCGGDYQRWDSRHLLGRKINVPFLKGGKHPESLNWNILSQEQGRNDRKFEIKWIAWHNKSEGYIFRNPEDRKSECLGGHLRYVKLRRLDLLGVICISNKNIIWQTFLQ